jgi:hypothetical protein
LIVLLFDLKYFSRNYYTLLAMVLGRLRFQLTEKERLLASLSLTASERGSDGRG